MFAINTGLGRSPGVGNSNSLQYSSLEIPWTEKPGRSKVLELSVQAVVEGSQADRDRRGKEAFGEAVPRSVHTDWGDAQSWVEATPEWEGEEVRLAWCSAPLSLGRTT